MRVLGIDLGGPGSASVKAVELETALGGRFEVHEYHEQKVLPGQDPYEVAAALVESLPKKPERIAVAVPTHRTTTRNLDLPTKDKKAIQSSITFELEDELPFEIEDAIFDYSTLSAGAKGQQGVRIHIAATLRRYVEVALGHWAASGIDPDLITTESWAYRTLLNRIVSKEAPVMLAHLGHERTVLYVHHHGTPVLTREVRLGGQDLTIAISQKYGIPIDQAELAKLDNGFVLAPSQRAQASQEQREFSETLLTPLQELIREVRHAILTCKSLTHQGVETIYITGGTSLLPGLAHLIQEETQVPVLHLQPLSQLNPGVTYSEQTDAHFPLAASLALCLTGSERNAAINLRKGDLAKKGKTREINFAVIKRPLIALGVILLCLLASLTAQTFVYDQKSTKINAQLERSLRAFFTEASNSAIRGYLADTRRLRKELNASLSKRRQLSKLRGTDASSPLAFLKDLSATVPKDVVVDLIQYNVGAAGSEPYSDAQPANANLTFLVANPQVAEKLASLVESQLTGMQRSKMEEVPAPDGTGKRWKITFTGKVKREGS